MSELLETDDVLLMMESLIDNKLLSSKCGNSFMRSKRRSFCTIPIAGCSLKTTTRNSWKSSIWN
jgi:hypothetical protein